MVKVVVLRSDPVVLKNRLVERGYPRDKVIANVEAELIGLVSSEAFGTFGERRTFEIDTSKTSPAEASRLAVNGIRGNSGPRKKIDWTTNYNSARKLKSLLSSGTFGPKRRVNSEKRGIGTAIKLT